MQAERAAQAKVIGIDHLSVDFYLFAIDANVGDPVLSATVRAAGDVQLQMLIEAGQAVFQFFHQPAGKVLCFRDRELAELRAAAGDRAAPEGRTAHAQSNGIQFPSQVFGIELRNIHDEQVLHVGGAKFARREAIRQIGGGVHLLGGDSSAEHCGSHIAEARLLLRMDADVVAIHIRGRLFFDCGIELKSDSPLQFVQKALRRPTMPQEEKFQPRALTMLTQYLRVAKQFGDSLNRGQHLMPADKRV